MTDESLLTYNPALDRKGYFCDICGHEANGPGGLEQYDHCGEHGIMNICVSRCLS